MIMEWNFRDSVWNESTTSSVCEGLVVEFSKGL